MKPAASIVAANSMSRRTDPLSMARPARGASALEASERQVVAMRTSARVVPNSRSSGRASAEKP
jgi:hypothetical protein